MPKIDIKGDIVDNDTAQVYDWLDMQSVNPQDIQNKLNGANGQDIELDIASNGGDVFAASEIYTMLQQYNGNVTGVVQGLAASAATIIAMAADKLVMSPASQLMIHRGSEMVNGNTNDLTHEAGVMSGIDQTIASVYQAKTGMSQDDILDVMDKETWLTAKDAVEQGFADEILAVDQAKPLFTNSVASVPSKAAVNKILNLIKKPKPTASKHSDIFMSKLDILKGDK